MSGYKFWTKVGVAMASAAAGLGAAIPISAISAGSPATVTYTGAVDPANGNWILLTVQGMTEVNRRLFRVVNANAAANSFDIEGLDATGFNAFVAGSFQVVTFDKTFDTLSEPSSSGGEPVFEDTTLIHDTKDKQAIVSSSPEGYSFQSVWEPGNAALVEANRAFVTRTTRAVLVTFSDGAKYAFIGTVGAPMAPAASGRKVVTPVSFQLENTGTSYAS